MTYRRLSRGAALAVPALLLAPLRTAHITPTVVLVNHADAIRSTLPGAAHFFLRTVTIGRTDFDAIKREAHYTPDDDNVKFFYGTDREGALTGTVLFPQVNTQHGPIEIGLTMHPDGSVAQVVVTKATVETKPWIEAAIKTGFLDKFQGMHTGNDVTRALTGLDRDHLGKMPAFMADITAQAVARGLVLYDVLFAPHLPAQGS